MQTREELLIENEKLKAQVKSLAEEQARLQKLNDWFLEQLKLSKKKIFGSSSEKTDNDLQLNLFNEAEFERVPLNVEPTVETITYKRKKQKGHREKMLSDFPVEVIEYDLPEEEKNCPKCGEVMHVMSKEIRKELKIIPAQVKVVEHVSYVYSCRNCEKNEIETPVVAANVLKGLIPKSLVSPSLMAYIMSQKYVNALPLYRQDQEFKRMNILLSRQTLANWMIKGADILKPLSDRMKKELLSKKILHADETTLEVLCEPGRPVQTNSYMWLYRTSGCDEPIVLYDYKEGRSGEFAEKFLNGFSGYLHTDGWGGYHRLEDKGITLCGCWAHARRKFDEVLSIMKEKNSESIAAKGLDYCNRLFKIEEELKKLSFEDRYKLRQQKSKPIADEFFEWAEKIQAQTLPQSLQGKAIQYSVNQKKYLLSFLKDGRIELSNNRAERSIKPFVIGRKNWLFCNTPAGAESSAIIYSIIETAKENGLKPFEYLTFIFENIQISNSNLNMPYLTIDMLLPWSESIPDFCKMKNK